MYHLATIFPPAKRIPWPLSRDQIMLLLGAVNQLFLGLDIYFAHRISGTIVPNEWIPIIFGPIAGLLLLISGLIARRNRSLATTIATLTFLVSIGVGLLGAYFHLIRGIWPTAPAGEQVSVDLLVWAPPILGPLMFSLIGLLGISAIWIEDPPDSGNLRLLGDWHIQLPYSKTRAYFYITGMACLATVISSVLDHARADFENPWLWLPTAAGIFGSVVGVMLGAIDRPGKGDLYTYTAAMVLLILVGLIGAWLHVAENLTAGGAFVFERFVRGAPVLAPLLFSNVGMLGLIVLLDPREERTEEKKPAFAQPLTP